MKKTVRIFSLCLILLLCSSPVCSASDSIVQNTADYLRRTVSAPAFGQTGGEWTVIGLLQAGMEKTDPHFAAYKENLSRTLAENNGVLSGSKYTEYARVVLALSALGENPRDFWGYDLVEPLYDFEKVTRQGINGSAFALIALCQAGEGGGTAAADYRDDLLARQQACGGFGLSEEQPDADVTAMAIRALCPYRSSANVEEAIQAGLAYLSAVQQADGGFLSSDGVETAETASQVLLAVKAAGRSADDPAFVKNGSSIEDALCAFAAQDGGFRHIKQSGAADLMATEQALLALSAPTAYRFDSDAAWHFINALFDTLSNTYKGEKS